MLKTLGRGTQAKVKLCECATTGQQYAAKFYDRQSLMKRRTSGRNGSSPLMDLHREITIMGRLCDGHIVQLFEVVDDPRQQEIILFLEFLRGEVVLKGLTTNQLLSEREARRVFVALARGLLVCHQAGVLHRDIKPENLLRAVPLSEELGDSSSSRRRSSSERNGGGDTVQPTIKLADFGVASCFTPGQSDLVRDTVGTPAFHSPECFSSSSETGYSGIMADVWAVGVSLFQMVFGRPPFMASSMMETYRKARDEPVDMSPQANHGVKISGALAELLALLLHKDPSQRLRLEHALQHPWCQQTARGS